MALIYKINIKNQSRIFLRGLGELEAEGMALHIVKSLIAGGLRNSASLELNLREKGPFKYL